MRILTCSNCQARVDEASVGWDKVIASGLCPECGQPFSERAPSAAEGSPVPVTRNTRLIECQECGAEVSKLARKCPHCGGPPTRLLKVSDTLMSVGWLLMLLTTLPALIFLFFLFFLFNG